MKIKKKYEKAYQFINKLKWFAIIFDNGELRRYNIFNNVYIRYFISKALVNYVDYNKFKEDIRSALSYSFRSKVEYEIVCSEVFSKNGYDVKIDVYYQVIENLDILCKYIIYEYNKIKRKKLII